jgi:hypothetical protein
MPSSGNQNVRSNPLTPWLVGYCNNMEMETGKSHELKKNQNTFNPFGTQEFYGNCTGFLQKSIHFHRKTHETEKFSMF